jgi:hypothetical protein
MYEASFGLNPPQKLAITYAPVSARSRLGWLLAIDQRLLSVLHRASEPMIAQLRLSWWRDALKAPFDKRPKGEPLLAGLGDLEPDTQLIGAALALVDVYEILVTDDDAHQQNSAHAARIGALVGAYAHWIGASPRDRERIDDIEAWWGNPALPRPKKLPAKTRTLSILAMAEHAAQLPVQAQSFRQGLRLNWHALTGR